MACTPVTAGKRSSIPGGSKARLRRTVGGQWHHTQARSSEYHNIPPFAPIIHPSRSAINTNRKGRLKVSIFLGKYQLRARDIYCKTGQNRVRPRAPPTAGQDLVRRRTTLRVLASALSSAIATDAPQPPSRTTPLATPLLRPRQRPWRRQRCAAAYYATAGQPSLRGSL